MHPILRAAALSSLILSCAACSTVVEGRSQKITVASSPQGAQCLIKQADDVVGRVTTPGTAEVEKTKNDLIIFCSKAGYESVSVKNHSDYALASLGNLAFGQFSFVGNAVDSLSGANNKYDSKVFVELAPATAPTAFPAPPAPLPVMQLPMQVAQNMSMQVPMPALPADAAVMAVPVASVVSTPLTEAAPAALAPALTLPAAANPSLKASTALADAALKMHAAQQPALLTYAQAVEEMPNRPPFAITQ